MIVYSLEHQDLEKPNTLSKLERGIHLTSPPELTYVEGVDTMLAYLWYPDLSTYKNIHVNIIYVSACVAINHVHI